MRYLRNIGRRAYTLFTNKAIVLSYHRIAEPELDPFCLAVSPVNFELQLKALRKYFNIISVEELIHNLSRGKVINKSVCLTFDDGYQDNYLFAKPVLESFNCPASFFIPTFFINSNCQFWWDELIDLLFKSTELQNPIILNINGSAYQFYLDNGHLQTNAQLAQFQNWKIKEKTSNKRCELFAKLTTLLTALPYQKIKKILNDLKKQTDFPHLVKTKNEVITREQLLEFIQNPLFEIGLHTHTHSALDNLSFYEQEKEIQVNKKILQEFGGREIFSLAYPNGRYNDTTKEVLANYDIKAAFTTKQKVVNQNVNKFELGRFKVKNWNDKQLKERIDAWFFQ